MSAVNPPVQLHSFTEISLVSLHGYPCTQSFTKFNGGLEMDLALPVFSPLENALVNEGK